MVIAICTSNREEYENMAGWSGEYGDHHGMRITAKWFQTYEAFLKSCTVEFFPIIIFAFDDIINQELAITVRGGSQTSRLIWVGEDRRFGVSSYRVGAAYFLLKPVEKEGIRKSLARCFV